MAVSGDPNSMTLEDRVVQLEGKVLQSAVQAVGPEVQKALEDRVSQLESDLASLVARLVGSLDTPAPAPPTATVHETAGAV